MSTATLTSEEQLTMPAAVRSALSIEAGDRVGFIELEPGH